MTQAGRVLQGKSPRDGWNPQKLEETGRTLSQNLQKRLWPHQHLDLEFWPPELSENQPPVFKAPQVVVIYHSSPRTLTHLRGLSGAHVPLFSWTSFSRISEERVCLPPPGSAWPWQ